MPTFQFNTSDNLNAAKYEGVKVLAGTPKNPNDFHSLQDIIRYRNVMMLKELYGNARVDTDGTPTPFVLNAQNKIEATGVWYLDGYRIALDTLTSAEVYTSGEMFIYLKISFDTVNYVDDPSIALKDPVSKKLIPTSERFRFLTSIHVSDVQDGSDITVVPGDYLYKLGTITDSVIVENPDIAQVNLTFSEALEIAQNAISTNQDGYAYIPKIATNSTGAKMFFEKVGSEQFKYGFKNAAGKTISAFESVYSLGKWNPIFWMMPDVEDYPRSFMTTSGYYTQDSNNNNAKFTASQIYSGHESLAHLNVEAELFDYQQIPAGGVGLQVVQEAESKAKWTTSVTKTSGEDATADSSYEKATTIQGGTVVKTSIYTFFVPYNDKEPQNGKVNVNNHISIVSGNTYEGYIKLNVYWKGAPQASYQLLTNFGWGTNIGNRTIDSNVSFLFNFNDYALDYGGIDFKLEYTLSSNTAAETITGKIQFLASGNIHWYRYDTPFSLAEVRVLKINGVVLWIDAAGRLRAKSVTEETQGAATSLMFDTASPGSAITDAGGKEIGGIQTIAVSIDQNITQPVFATVGGVYTLKFPNASTGVGVTGLISGQALNDIYSSIHNTGQLLYSSGTVYVSPTFTDNSWPRFEGISEAIGAIHNAAPDLNDPNASSTYTIIVYPGTYTENVALTNGISVVAVVPEQTVILGKVTITGAFYSLHEMVVNIPIRQTGNDTALNISASNLTINLLSKVTSTATSDCVVMSGSTLMLNSKNDITASAGSAVMINSQYASLKHSSGYITNNSASLPPIRIAASISAYTIPTVQLNNSYLKNLNTAASYSIDGVDVVILRAMNTWATKVFHPSHVSNVVVDATAFKVDANI